MARILIVDDDDDVREMLRQMLQRIGHTIDQASNGVEGLAAYRAAPADLVVLDIVMPEKEGIETLQELRQEWKDVKVIAISGGGRVGPKSYIKMAKSFGANRTFEKPFDRKEFLAAVEELVGSD